MEIHITKKDVLWGYIAQFFNIGAGMLTADILARVLYSAELPISILTTVIGVPILVYFLCTRGKETA